MASSTPPPARAAGYNPPNRFEKQHYERSEEPEPFEEESDPRTSFTTVHPKTILNKVESPDVVGEWSMNPYQGCEHGCIYCFARPTHEYWGYSAGLDFEKKILVKENAPTLLRAAFEKASWQPKPIMLAGNTDCYQPVERKLRLTRQLLEICLQYRNPVSIITKNSLILRDLDILKELAALNLVHVSISFTSMDEDLRRRLEPRTATAKRRLLAMRNLSAAGVPVNAMIAPIIPGLTDHEVPRLLEAAAANGASTAHYTIVRLNGALGPLFTDWLHTHYPDRAGKVLRAIRAAHGGQLNDSRPGLRMRGEGQRVESIRDLFYASRKKYFIDREYPPFDLTLFRRQHGGQMSLF